MKSRTLVWTLSSSAVYRNLFFFPGSVFDRVCGHLRANGDERVVFVIPPQFREKYGPLLVPPDLTGRIIVKVVDVPPARMLGERAFYFFYSYLVYTGTTKIMATMGTRPDEPPAGGKWYLAWLKRLIALTLGRSDAIKRHLVPYLWLRIFTARPFKEIFDEYQPDLVFAAHIYGWFDAHALAEARRRGIATIGMPAGWDHLDKYFLPFHVDRLLVGGGQVERMALEHQAYDRAAVTVAGYPHFDFIVRREYLVPRSEALTRLGFAESSQYILYVSGSAYAPDEPDIIEEILAWMDEGRLGPDVRLVIRPYLGGRGKDKAFDTEKFERFAAHPRVRFYKQEFWGDLEKSFEFMNILAHADVVMALYTTMIVEAAVLDRPLVAPAFDGRSVRPYRRSIKRFMEFDHFREVLATGGLHIARDFDDLFSALEGYLKDPSRDGEKRRKLRQTVCGILDGESSSRIAAALFKRF